MSTLKWTTAVYHPYSDQSILTTYWELWDKGMDRTAWYNLPCASIKKIRDRVWELTIPNDPEFEARQFTTLKAAKAMGIALYRMDTNE